MSFWEKIRKLPLIQRKIILWTVVSVIGVVSMGCWLENVFQKLEYFRSSPPELPPVHLEEAFEDLPEFEIPPELLEVLKSQESVAPGETLPAEQELKENDQNYE